MSRRYLLDTNIVSYIVKGRSPAARAKLAGLPPGEIACISTITEAELWYGLALSPKAQVLRAAIEGFLGKIQIVAWGRDEARVYGNIRAKQTASGTRLGNLDMLIAAQAVAIGAVLVTGDKAFSRVLDLVAVVNWATDL